jgi:hypothetical protein
MGNRIFIETSKAQSPDVIVYHRDIHRSCLPLKPSLHILVFVFPLLPWEDIMG